MSTAAGANAGSIAVAVLLVSYFHLTASSVGEVSRFAIEGMRRIVPFFSYSS